LLFDVPLEDLVIARGLGGTRRGSTVRLGLADFAAAVEFPIAVDAKAGTAKGWFIRDGRDIKLDMGEGVAVVDGRKFAIPPGDLERGQGDIQVPTSTLAKWFPLSLHRPQ